MLNNFPEAWAIFIKIFMELTEVCGNQCTEEKFCLGARAFDLLKRLCCMRVVNPILSEGIWLLRSLKAVHGTGKHFLLILVMDLALEHSFGYISWGFHKVLIEKIRWYWHKTMYEELLIAAAMLLLRGLYHWYLIPDW